MFLLKWPIYLPKKRNNSTLIQLIESKKIGYLATVPTCLATMVNNKNFSPQKVSSLKTIALSGSEISSNKIKKIAKLLKNTFILNFYGSTETGPVSSTVSSDSYSYIINSIGKPFQYFDVKIKDLSSSSYLASYKKGEILVKGASVAESYYGCTSDKNLLDYEGYYHTGDIGYFDDNNYLFYVGRCKNVINRGGEKIMPGEVSSIIEQHDSISEAEVVGIKDDTFVEIIAAAIIIKNNYNFCENNLREFLKKKLSKFKIPKYFIVFDEFPKLANGKVDKKKLKGDILSDINNNK